MQVVYISHQLTAETREGFEKNRRNAAKWVSLAGLSGFAPVADWITLSGEWSELDGRERGLSIDCAQIERCDALWLCGGSMSPGMDVELSHARRFGIPVVDMLPFGYEPPASLGNFFTINEEMSRPPLGSTHAALTGEVTRARRKFPGSRFMLAALMEEVGELAQAIIQKQPAENIRKEALQVACCAVRMLEEGDSSFDTITDAEANGVLPVVGKTWSP